MLISQRKINYEINKIPHSVILVGGKGGVNGLGKIFTIRIIY